MIPQNKFEDQACISLSIVFVLKRKDFFCLFSINRAIFGQIFGKQLVTFLISNQYDCTMYYDLRNIFLLTCIMTRI